jgi:type II secretory pathway pseudopilin PulG
MYNLRKTNETGRSMVEMLGVLAIMGVLSVGGVYGYGVAMKKHKANELLHQASMLATTISEKIQSKGELPQNIEDFGNGKYGTFKKPEKANDEQFTMQIENMDPAVCEQVAKMAGGMVREAECSDTTLTLTYNNNLSTDKVAADYNGKQEECEESGNK